MNSITWMNSSTWRVRNFNSCESSVSVNTRASIHAESAHHPYRRSCSRRGRSIRKDNCWRRSMHPRLEKAGLGWANFQVMRRTHATLMKALGVDGKLVADQLGHSLDVNQNVYTQSSVEIRHVAVNQLERSVKV